MKCFDVLYEYTRDEKEPYTYIYVATIRSSGTKIINKTCENIPHWYLGQLLNFGEFIERRLADQNENK